jgi:hypothetical protein
MLGSFLFIHTITLNISIYVLITRISQVNEFASDTYRRVTTKSVMRHADSVQIT